MYGNVNGGSNYPYKAFRQNLWDGAYVDYYILPQLKLVMAYIFIGSGIIQANSWYSYRFPDEVGTPAYDREAPLTNAVGGSSSARLKVDKGNRRINLYTGNLENGSKPAGMLIFQTE